VRVSVFGLGYVGSVSAACLASMGHEVVGVDSSEIKVSAVNSGNAPVLEGGLGELLGRQVSQGRLRATTDGQAAVEASEVTLIAVGTPSRPNGSLSTDALVRVTRTIAAALRSRGRDRHTVVVRSTMLPGTAENVLIPLLEQDGELRVGRDIGFAVNPEFLREGTALRDFNSAGRTVIGEFDTRSGDTVERMYVGLDVPVIRMPLKSAEMAKYVDNAFHAVKITFANEIGAICQMFGLDSHEVMQSFFADTKLNISPAYLTPGFAFGGSCLPKDLRALLHASGRNDVAVPMLSSVLESNKACVNRVVDSIITLDKRRVGFFGLSFKPGTDDLRESPYVELAERLLGRGFEIKIYDPNISLASLTGGNREYIDKRIPHLFALLSDSVDEVMEHSEICVVAQRDEEVCRQLVARNQHHIVDLVRLPDVHELRGTGGYYGVAW
jgi:GDP-mannose 6-dehydrogenase